MSKVVCSNLSCNYNNNGECGKETIELSHQYMEDSDGKSYLIQYCLDEEVE